MRTNNHFQTWRHRCASGKRSTRPRGNQGSRQLLFLNATVTLTILLCCGTNVPVCRGEQPNSQKARPKRSAAQLSIEKTADRTFELIDGDQDGLLEVAEIADAPKLIQNSIHQLMNQNVIGGSKALGSALPEENLDAMHDVTREQFRRTFEVIVVNADVQLRLFRAQRHRMPTAMLGGGSNPARPPQFWENAKQNNSVAPYFSNDWRAWQLERREEKFEERERRLEQELIQAQWHAKQAEMMHQHEDVGGHNQNLGDWGGGGHEGHGGKADNHHGHKSK